MNNKISFFLIVYNEEKVIERCLESIKYLADQIIVIHDGPCDDNTIKISKKYTSECYETKENLGIGEKHYIDALKKCKNDWIFKIDADEYIDKQDYPKIKNLTLQTEIDAFSFKWPLGWNGIKYSNKNNFYKLCLFRKNSVGYVNIFHLPLIVKGQIKEVDITLHHKPSKFDSKGNNYTKLKNWSKKQALDYLKDFSEFETFNLSNIELKHIEEKFNIKKKIYRYPLIVFLTSIVISIYYSRTNLIRNPIHILKEIFKGALYSYYVSWNYNEIKKNL